MDHEHLIFRTMALLKMSDEPEPMRTVDAAIPPDPDEAVRNALRREPKERPTFARFEEMVRAAVA